MEALQGVVERNQQVRRLRDGRGDVVQWNSLEVTTALGGQAAAGVIDQDAPHGGRRHRHEVGARRPLSACLLAEREVRLVDEIRGRECVTCRFMFEVQVCDAA